MSQSIDKTKARSLLEKAYDKVNLPYEPYSRFFEKIKEIILGEHLTFRYILLTGVLAKAANENANPLALQASSSLLGAYDARSLCHQVVVKFEKV